MSQYADLKVQIARLQQQAIEARRTEVGNVVAEIRKKISEYNLTAQDLGFSLGTKRGRPPQKLPQKPRLPGKYQDPLTGKTWSGRGSPPKWIAGENRDRFLIEQG